MYNPDCPTTNTAGFLQHTYQQPQVDSTLFWNGSGFGGYGMPQNNDFSRRNIGNSVNPFNTFGQTGMGQNNTIPESMVQPFSSYPPSTPQQNPCGGGLNSMIDSRRNMGMPNTGAQNNPWAPPTTPQSVMPNQQTMSVFSAVPSQQPQFNPFESNGMYGYPGYKIEMSTMALYDNGGNYSFDRHNSWDNYYTNPRQIQPPVIDWRASSPQNQMMNNQWNNSFNPVNFFGGQNNDSSLTWSDMANQNWSVGK